MWTFHWLYETEWRTCISALRNVWLYGMEIIAIVKREVRCLKVFLTFGKTEMCRNLSEEGCVVTIGDV